MSTFNRLISDESLRRVCADELDAATLSHDAAALSRWAEKWNDDVRGLLTAERREIDWDDYE